jgi:hypothetical protein
VRIYNQIVMSGRGKGKRVAPAIITTDNVIDLSTNTQSIASATRVIPVFNQEKRIARFRSIPTPDVIQRIQRALQQRMYLIEQVDLSDESGLAKKFVVLGSTGNVYEVIIDKRPRCSCPDCERGHLCKHIIFVILKVLRVPNDSPIVYQKALLQSELHQIFESSQNISPQITASDTVISAYKQTIGIVDERESLKSGHSENHEYEEEDCPICFEPILIKGREIIEKCRTCRKSVHRECLLKWLLRTPSCCYCRADWTVSEMLSGGSFSPTATSFEGFVNLGRLQGLSESRGARAYKRSRN